MASITSIHGFDISGSFNVENFVTDIAKLLIVRTTSKSGQMHKKSYFNQATLNIVALLFHLMNCGAQ